MVCWGCSVSRAQKTWSWSLLFKVFPPQVINSCIYPKLKISLTFTLTLLLEIRRKGLDLRGNLVLDVKIERASSQPRSQGLSTTMEAEKRGPGNEVGI